MSEGRGSLAAVALMMSVLTAVSFVGVVVVGASLTQPAPVAAAAASTTAKHAVPKAQAAATPAPSLPADTRALSLAVAKTAKAIAFELAQPTEASVPGGTTAEPAADPTVNAEPAAASGPSKGIDAAAATAGFGGAYRFEAKLTNIPGVDTLGTTVRGFVLDAEHYQLEFPDSTFITRYTRSGADAVAVIDGHEVSVALDGGTFDGLSPEVVLPAQLWLRVVEPWADLLRSGSLPGAYTAETGILTAHAHAEGLVAKDWRMTAGTDATGRLVSLVFSGERYGLPFSMELTVSYS